MQESENLAGWLMLSCLSLFIASMIAVASLLGMYLAEARHYQKHTGETSNVFDEIWADFGPKKQIVKRIAKTASPTVLSATPVQPARPLQLSLNAGSVSAGSSPAAAPSPLQR